MTDLTPASSALDNLIAPWWSRWIGMHWGFRRHAAVYWCATGTVSPLRAQGFLGIPTVHPVRVVVFYREYVETLIPEPELARAIVEMTPREERKWVRRICAGQNAFESSEGSRHTIARLIDNVISPAGLPKLWPTDDGPGGRVSSARMFLHGIRRASLLRGGNPTPADLKSPDPLILISRDCPELLEAIPALMADPKNPEDTQKTGEKQDDIWEAAKNAFREYPAAARSAPLEVRRREAAESATTPQGRYIKLLEFDRKNKSGPILRKR